MPPSVVFAVSEAASPEPEASSAFIAIADCSSTSDPACPASSACSVFACSLASPAASPLSGTRSCLPPAVSAEAISVASFSPALPVPDGTEISSLGLPGASTSTSTSPASLSGTDTVAVSTDVDTTLPGAVERSTNW